MIEYMDNEDMMNNQMNVCDSDFDRSMTVL